MRALRIVQMVALVLLALYLVAFNNLNPDPLTMPLLPMVIPLPPILIVVAALVIGWLVGWLPPRIKLWRRNREVRRLRDQVAALERHGDLRAYDLPQAAVIPDRFPVIPDRPAPQPDEEAETS
ncbi:MAG TPA: lipopolysaccharide assembly protein LapA domain-containing protein [Trueperaceae bacterium]|nr:lipopolysaccharide assembly protein LapA domain-containing protein [Trueperaceae bacterium]